MVEYGTHGKRNDIGKRPLTPGEKLERNLKAAGKLLSQASYEWLDVYHGEAKQAMAEELAVEVTLPPFSFVTSVEKYLGYYQEPVSVDRGIVHEAELILEAETVKPPAPSEWTGEEMLVHVS